jgi:hypothetical protein
MIGISIDRWSHSCWSWLHHCTIPLNVIDLLPSVLPCSMCSIHLHNYQRLHPVYEPTSGWLVELHNDVNVRTGKLIVSAIDARQRHECVDGRLVFTQFVFAIAFTLSANENSRHRFQQFCTAAFPTVGLHPPDPWTTGVSVPEQLFLHMKPYGYMRFHEMVVDFVPPSMYTMYGVSDTDGLVPVVQYAPCDGAIVAYVIQSIVHEEFGADGAQAAYQRTTERMAQGDLQTRIHHFCPFLRESQYTMDLPKTPPSVQECTSPACITDVMVNCSSRHVKSIVVPLFYIFWALFVLVLCVRFPHHRRIYIVIALLCFGVYVVLCGIGYDSKLRGLKIPDTNLIAECV